MKKLFFLLNLLLIAPVFSQNNTSNQIVKNVGPEEFKKEIEAKSGILIDLRTHEELKSKGKIKGAIQIDFFSKEAENIITKLDKNKTYLIYCAGGGRSSQCADLMIKYEFKKVIHLHKGFDDWKKKGFDVDLK